MPRVVDAQVGDKLRSVPVALVEGVRGCGKLLALRAKVDPSMHDPPKALIVITSTGQPCMRDDGVGVAPLTALRP